MLYFNCLYENVIAPSANTNNNTNGLGWKKWILPAAAIAGAGLLEYGGYNLYQDHQNKQAALGILDNQMKGLENQIRESEKRYGISEKDSFVNNNPAKQVYDGLRQRI